MNLEVGSRRIGLGVESGKRSVKDGYWVSNRNLGDDAHLQNNIEDRKSFPLRVSSRIHL